MAGKTDCRNGKSRRKSGNCLKGDRSNDGLSGPQQFQWGFGCRQCHGIGVGFSTQIYFSSKLNDLSLTHAVKNLLFHLLRVEKMRIFLQLYKWAGQAW